MQINRRFFDGLMLVVIGAVLLLNTLGIIPWSVWNGLWRFWPLLLVIVGVSLIFRRTIPFVALLTGALIVILIISWMFPNIATTPWQNWSFGGFNIQMGDQNRNHEDLSKPLNADVVGKPFRAEINFDAGELYIRGTTDQAFSGAFDYYGAGPSVNMDSDNSGTVLKIGNSANDFPFISGGPRRIWNLAFNPDVPLTLLLDASAGKSDLDLTQYNLTELGVDASAGDYSITLGDKAAEQDVNVDMSAGSTRIRVGKAALTTISIDASAGSVELTIDPSVAIRVHQQTSVSSSNVSSLGLIKDGDYYVSPNYDQAAKKCDIDYRGSASSLNIRH